jgi:tripartite-type tricarboxylate transporter receptor subunit TctC
MNLRRPVLGSLLAGALSLSGLAPHDAQAQTSGTPGGAWPSRAVRIICPLPPGSPSDVLARLVGERLSLAWGQPVVVENRPGATGAIGMDAVAKATPDGYTAGVLFMTHTVLPSLFGKVPYSTERDLLPVSNLVWLYNVLSVPAGSPITGMPALLAQARSTPGKLNYASGGNGSPAHLIAEFFRQQSGAAITHVPFKGPADAVQALVAGQVDMMFATTSTAVPQVRAGRLRAIAVTSPARLAALPEVPTMAEVGVTGFDVKEWQGITLPAGVPPEIVARWTEGLQRTMAEPAVRDRLAGLGMETAAPNSPEQFGALVRSELDRWSGLVKSLGLKVD